MQFTLQKAFSDMCEIVKVKVGFKNKTGLCIISSLSRSDSDRDLFISLFNLQSIGITIPRNTDISFLKFLSPQQAGT